MFVAIEDPSVDAGDRLGHRFFVFNSIFSFLMPVVQCFYLACIIGRGLVVFTELIDRKNNAINCINCVWISTEVYGHFPFSFTLQ